MGMQVPDRVLAVGKDRPVPTSRSETFNNNTMLIRTMFAGQRSVNGAYFVGQEQQ